MATPSEQARDVLIPCRGSGNESGLFGRFFARVLACIFVLICLAVGIVGLILPLIPGLLFLVAAAMIAARHSPSLDRWLRKNPLAGSYLDSGRGFLALSWWGKIRLILWLCLKLFIDSILLIFTLLARLFNFTASRPRYYR